eukprot:COSAG01_NODE_144_length_24108_cov_11.490441_4_plen_46_part_00
MIANLIFETTHPLKLLLKLQTLSEDAKQAAQEGKPVGGRATTITV